MPNLEKQKGVVSLHIPALVTLLAFMFIAFFKLFSIWVENYKLERIAYFSSSVLADAADEQVSNLSEKLRLYSISYLYGEKDVSDTLVFKVKKMKDNKVIYEQIIGGTCSNSDLYDYRVNDNQLTITYVEICISEQRKASKIRVSA